MNLRVFSLIIVISIQLSFTQSLPLSKDATISVLTFGPGESLNDAFGHNAFRITDTSRGIDLVYGYGEYDFDAPFFYLKFAQGKLNYLLSRHKFRDILSYYSRKNRSIEEQLLNLDYNEKQKLFNYLENNYKPENRRYLYDFFYDNCATKIRDVTEIASSGTIEYINPEGFKPKTFRSLIYEHVPKNTWGGLGIDLALGSIIDQEASTREYMFLPKYINSSFDSAKINNNRDLVESHSSLYIPKNEKTSLNILLSPLLVLSLLGAIIIYITYRDYQSKSRSVWLDMTLNLITGTVGIVLFLLWFATDHTATGYNYNLLWAFPFNLILLGQLNKAVPKKWVKGYIKFLILMLCLLTMHWLIGIQVFALTLIPLLLAITIRYLYVLKVLK